MRTLVPIPVPEPLVAGTTLHQEGAPAPAIHPHHENAALPAIRPTPNPPILETGIDMPVKTPPSKGIFHHHCPEAKPWHIIYPPVMQHAMHIPRTQPCYHPIR